MSCRLRRVAAAALIALLLAPLLAPLQGCAPGGDQAAEVRVALEAAPRPLAVGPATLSVRLTDADGAPVSGAALQLEGTMSHAGMVPVFADARERADAPGTYVARLELTMGGDWLVIVTGALADGRRLERVLSLPGVAAT